MGFTCAGMALTAASSASFGEGARGVEDDDDGDDDDEDDDDDGADDDDDEGTDADDGDDGSDDDDDDGGGDVVVSWLKLPTEAVRRGCTGTVLGDR